ncbi:hypothetical protein DSUL_50005 [Desulfovibrionales bacterium]
MTKGMTNIATADSNKLLSSHLPHSEHGAELTQLKRQYRLHAGNKYTDSNLDRGPSYTFTRTSRVQYRLELSAR